MTDLFSEMTDATTPREAFAVTDTSSATWAMRKLAAIRRKQADIAQAADAEILRIADWAAAEQRKLLDSANYFERLLIDYHQHIIADDPRAKTVTLPHGKLTVRQQQPQYQRDDDVLLEWAKATSPELVVVSESPNWIEIKQYGKAVGGQFFDPATGEVIPGVTVIHREPKFFVEVETDADRG